MAKKKTAKKRIKKTANRAAKRGSSSDEVVIVKRGAHAQQYDDRKVYASAYFACRNAHLTEKEAEKIAEMVLRSITRQVKKEKIILSDRIFQLITAELKKYNEDAAFLYETHRDLS